MSLSCRGGQAEPRASSWWVDTPQQTGLAGCGDGFVFPEQVSAGQERVVGHGLPEAMLLSPLECVVWGLPHAQLRAPTAGGTLALRTRAVV